MIPLINDLASMFCHIRRVLSSISLAAGRLVSCCSTLFVVENLEVRKLTAEPKQKFRFSWKVAPKLFFSGRIDSLEMLSLWKILKFWSFYHRDVYIVY